MSGFAPGALSDWRIFQFSAPPAAWDDFVAAAEGSTFCHLAGWERVMREVFAHDCIYLVAADEAGTWRGVLPLVQIQSALTGRHFVSMPYLNAGGPLGEESARTALAMQALDLAKHQRVKLLEIRAPQQVPGPLPRVVWKISTQLPLPESVDGLWESGLGPTQREQVQRATKIGLATRFGADQLDGFYRVFTQNMHDLGTPTLPRRFFEQVAKTFPEQVMFAVAHHEERPVAGACGFLWRDRFEIAWTCALREYDPPAPTVLLYWNLMAEVVRRGARVFDFGRGAPGPGNGVELEWEGAERPVPWLRWPPPSGGRAASADSGLQQLAARTWRRLPAPLANRVGPILASHLPWY